MDSCKSNASRVLRARTRQVSYLGGPSRPVAPRIRPPGIPGPEDRDRDQRPIVVNPRPRHRRFTFWRAAELAPWQSPEYCPAMPPLMQVPGASAAYARSNSGQQRLFHRV